MKKIALLLAICLISALTVFTVSGEGYIYDTTVTVTNGATAVASGDKITVKVSCDNITAQDGIVTADVDLKYDTSVLEYLSHTVSSVSGWTVGVNTNSTSQGKISLFAVDEGLGSNAVTVSGKIWFTVTFKVLQTEKSSFSMSVSKATAIENATKKTLSGSLGSKTVSIKKALSVPTGLVWDGGKAKWDSVENASGYDVQIYKDNKEYGNAVSVTGKTEYDFTSTLTDGGKYYFTVIAKSSKAEFVNSAESSRSEVAYTVIGKLATPRIVLTSDIENTGFTYQITDTNPTGSVSKYRVVIYLSGTNTVVKTIDGQKAGSVLCDGNVIMPGKLYNATVIALTSDESSYLNSAASARSASVTAYGKLKGISIKTQPKLIYNEGDKLDLSGLVVSFNFEVGTSVNVKYSSFSEYNLSVSKKNGSNVLLGDNGNSITVSYGNYNASTNAISVLSGDCSHEKTHQEHLDATCGVEGYDRVVCDDCENTVSENQIPATGNHQFGEWKIISEASDTENGLRERECLVCGHVEQEEILYSDTTDTGASDTDETTASGGDTTIGNNNDSMSDISRIFLIVVIVIFSLILVFIIGAVWIENRRIRHLRKRK